MTDAQSPCDHETVVVHLICPDCGEELDRREIRRSDLEDQQVQSLPNRAAMSVIDGNLGGPLSSPGGIISLLQGDAGSQGSSIPSLPSTPQI